MVESTSKSSACARSTFLHCSSSSTSGLRSLLEVRRRTLTPLALIEHLALLTGWIVTYVQDVRSGGPSAGYISSGFFGGA